MPGGRDRVSGNGSQGSGLRDRDLGDGHTIYPFTYDLEMEILQEHLDIINKTFKIGAI
jgi:hypothetical protein